MNPTGFEPSGTLVIAVWLHDDQWMTRVTSTTRPDDPLDLGQTPRPMSTDDVCDAVREWLLTLRQPRR